MPKLAAFPKAYMKALCADGTMTIAEWIKIGAGLNVEGLEWYAGFLEMADNRNWARFRKEVEEVGLTIPMVCCSPDFTHPDPVFRQKQMTRQQHWIDMSVALGAGFCRVLSGQRRPEISEEDGIRYAADCILACANYALENGVTLILENHYKDDFWEYPEFAQSTRLFVQLVNSLEHPAFGVNFDPSNAFLAGEDPIALLRQVLPRVVTMHASDRYLKTGTIEDLRKEESGSSGYAARLAHGEIGKGLNDYDEIFRELSSAGFDGWISIEDGVDGLDQLTRSISFLRGKIAEHFPSEKKSD